MPAFISQILILIFFSLVLGKSADLVVSFLARLSRQIRLTEFIASFIVLGVATSTPEIFVAISSGLDQVPQLSFGNLVGGVVIIFSLILGLTALFGGHVSVSHSLGSKELWLLIFLLASPLIVVVDGSMSRYDGLALIFLYVLYVSLLKKQKRFWAEFFEKILTLETRLFKSVFFLILGLFGLFISSKVLVDTALDFASTLNLPNFLVGMLILSLGTNLPEIVISIESIFKKHKSLAIGDFIGSAAANVLIIGLLGLSIPFRIVEINKILLSLLILLVVIPVFIVMSRTQDKLTRREGSILVLFYFGFVGIEFFFK